MIQIVPALSSYATPSFYIRVDIPCPVLGNLLQMDPLSVGGLALGAVSLTFQVFSGCVQGMLS